MEYWYPDFVLGKAEGDKETIMEPGRTGQV